MTTETKSDASASAEPAIDIAGHREAYEREGVTMIPGVLTPAEVARAQTAIDEVMARKDLPPGSGWDYAVAKGRFFMGMFLWTVSDGLRDVVTKSRLPRLAAELMGSQKVNLFYDQLFVKEPGTDSPTPWHHDQPYWPVSGKQVMSFWIALDPVTRDSGAVEYVRGSHQWKRQFQPKSFVGENKYGINPELEAVPDIESERERHDMACWDMAPGDVIAFHGLTLHGSGGNKARTQRRRGYAIRYTGDDVRYEPGPQTFMPLGDPKLKVGDPLDSELFPRLI